MKTKYFLAMLFLLAFNRAYTQEIELDPVTVSASLSQTRLSETGRHITILNGEQFTNLPVHSIDELLRYAPGIEIQARGPMGAQSDIVLRGGTFQQVLVILDGLRINDPNTGHFNGYIPISPNEIKRIEILKGASSAIYGPDAVGGVIHVITKSFAAAADDEKMDISGGFNLGQYGLLSGDAGLFIRKKKWAIGGGIVTHNAKGIQQRGTKGYFYNTTSSLSANYHFNEKWNMAYRLAIDNRDFAAQNFYTTYVFDTASEKVTSLWNQIRIARETKKQSFILDAGFKQVNDRYRFAPAASANTNRSGLFQVLGQYHRKISAQSRLVTGLNYQRKEIVSNDRGNHHLFMVSPFLSLTQKLSKTTSVRPSLQLVMHEKLDPEWVPQIDLVQKAGRISFRAGAGKTIRDADFTERYNNFNKPIVPSGSIGNPALKAERSLSYEGGVDWFLKDFLKLSGTFFQRHQRRTIDYITTPYDDMPRKDNLLPGGVYALAKNIALVNTTGVEAEVQFFRELRTDEKLNVSFGIVWLDTESSEETPSFYISSHAKLMTNFSVVYQFGPLTLSMNGIYKLRNPQASPDIYARITRDYFVLNARAGYSLPNQSFTVYAQADNVFDKKYSDLLGSVMPGRWISSGVRYRLQK